MDDWHRDYITLDTSIGDAGGCCILVPRLAGLVKLARVRQSVLDRWDIAFDDLHGETHGSVEADMAVHEPSAWIVAVNVCQYVCMYLLDEETATYVSHAMTRYPPLVRV